MACQRRESNDKLTLPGQGRGNAYVRKKFKFLAFAGALFCVGVFVESYRRRSSSTNTMAFVDLAFSGIGKHENSEDQIGATSIDTDGGGIKMEQALVCNTGPATSIKLIGERHSGTNWIANHLVDCFGDQIMVESSFSRWKHWFQYPDVAKQNQSAVVIAMFRDPYDWVEAMRGKLYHAHDHIGLAWKDFVMKPWAGNRPRGPADQARIEDAEKGLEKQVLCDGGFNFTEVFPCTKEDRESMRLGVGMGYMYEMRHDGSGRAYGSIIELRTAKIQNFLQVPEFPGVMAFMPARYEMFNMHGTSEFLSQVSHLTGLQANCKPFNGTGVTMHKKTDPGFVRWMNQYHDWSTEAAIGYTKRDP